MPAGIARAADEMSRGKRALANGFDEEDKGCAAALCGASARVLFSEIEPNCAPHAYKQKVYYVYGYRHSVFEGILHAMDVMTGGKR
eukprot:14260163-Heterocapsa_arctica.AAC.1